MKKTSFLLFCLCAKMVHGNAFVSEVINNTDAGVIITSEQSLPEKITVISTNLISGIKNPPKTTDGQISLPARSRNIIIGLQIPKKMPNERVKSFSLTFSAQSGSSKAEPLLGFNQIGDLFQLIEANANNKAIRDLIIYGEKIDLRPGVAFQNPKTLGLKIKDQAYYSVTIDQISKEISPNKNVANFDFKFNEGKAPSKEDIEFPAYAKAYIDNFSLGSIHSGGPRASIRLDKCYY